MAGNEGTRSSSVYWYQEAGRFVSAATVNTGGGGSTSQCLAVLDDNQFGEMRGIRVWGSLNFGKMLRVH
ncbi:hypothetical protein Hanom_Chr02g00100051 [Helianthus anomalus]